MEAMERQLMEEWVFGKINVKKKTKIFVPWG